MCGGRRTFMIAVLPLLGSVLERAVFGLLACAVAAVLGRELEPFTVTTVNTLLSGAQYQIFLTFLAALAILSGAASSLRRYLGDFGFGLVLVAVNATVFFMVGTLAFISASTDRKMKQKPLGMKW